MSISYEILTDRRLNVLKYTGSVDDSQYVEAYRSLFADPNHRLGFNELADMSGIQNLTITAEAMCAVVAMARRAYAKTSQVTRTAVVAPADFVFGLSRMYEAYADESIELVAVFRTHGEALDWLGAMATAES